GAARRTAVPVVRGPGLLRGRRAPAARALAPRLADGRSGQGLRADRFQVGRGRGRGGGPCHRAGNGQRSAKTMTAAISLIVLLVVLGSSIAVAAGMGLVGIILNQRCSSMPRTRGTGELTWS